MIKYKYGMKNRPFSIGCQPNDFIEVKYGNMDEGGFYWNFLIYDHELTDEDVARFELILMKVIMC